MIALYNAWTTRRFVLQNKNRVTFYQHLRWTKPGWQPCSLFSIWGAEAAYCYLSLHWVHPIFSGTLSQAPRDYCSPASKIKCTSIISTNLGLQISSLRSSANAQTYYSYHMRYSNHEPPNNRNRINNIPQARTHKTMDILLLPSHLLHKTVDYLKWEGKWK